MLSRAIGSEVQASDWCCFTGGVFDKEDQQGFVALSCEALGEDELQWGVADGGHCLGEVSGVGRFAVSRREVSDCGADILRPSLLVGVLPGLDCKEG